MDTFRDGLAFLGAIITSLLPFRLWRRLPSSFRMVPASFASGVITFWLAAAIGVPGFLEHAGYLVSETNAVTLRAAQQQIDSGMRDDDPKAVRFAPAMNAFAIFTFLLLTPKGWATMYLGGTGAFRLAAAWFDDPFGDPVLTGLDEILWRRRARRKARQDARGREELEGPEIPDRVVSSAKAGIPGCDFVIVSSRRKPGWARDVVVYTPEACYRIGDPVEQTVAGKLRTLYPLTEHVDLEAVRKSVNYDMPDAHSRD
jgi:hypothetical protein